MFPLKGFHFWYNAEASVSQHNRIAQNKRNLCESMFLPLQPLPMERLEAMLGGDEEAEERRGGGGGGRGRGQVGVPPVLNIQEQFASPRKNWLPEKLE